MHYYGVQYYDNGDTKNTGYAFNGFISSSDDNLLTSLLYYSPAHLASMIVNNVVIFSTNSS